MGRVLHHVRCGLVAVLGLMSVSVQAQNHCDRVSVSAYNNSLGTWPTSGYGDAGEAYDLCGMAVRGFVGPGFTLQGGWNITVSSLTCDYVESTRTLRLLAQRIDERRETFTTPACVSQSGLGASTQTLRTLTLPSNTPGCATRPIAHFQRPAGDTGTVCYVGCRYTWLLDPASNVTNAYFPDGAFCTGASATTAPPETAPDPPDPDPDPTDPPTGGFNGQGPDPGSDYIVDMLAPRIEATTDAVGHVEQALGAINDRLRTINTEDVRREVSGMRADMNNGTDRIVAAIEGLGDTSGDVPDDSGIVDPTRESVVQSVSAQTLLSGLDESGWSLSRSCPAHSWPQSFDLGWFTVDIGPSVGLVCSALAILGWMIGLAGLIQASFILSRIGGGGG